MHANELFSEFNVRLMQNRQSASRLDTGDGKIQINRKVDTPFPNVSVGFFLSGIG